MTTTPSTPSSRNRIGLGLNRPRPSHLNTPFANTSYSNGNSSSGLPHPSSAQRPTSPLLSPSTMLARKASLNQLTQNSLASIPDGSMGYGLGSPTRSTRNGDDGRHRGRATPIAGDVDVGDQVNTPGGMHGTVKFIGVVKGKAGVFVGVELDHDMAGRGKNDGAVDGLVILFYVSSNCVLFHHSYLLLLHISSSYGINSGVKLRKLTTSQCPLLHHRPPKFRHLRPPHPRNKTQFGLLLKPSTHPDSP